MASLRTLERFPQTFDEVVNADRGHVFVDEYEEGIRFVILRGGASLCAYVGIPKTHPLAGFDYDDLPLEAHGGLTYSGAGIAGYESMWFYGWDYAHAGDRSTYDHKREDRFLGLECEWTVADVYDDSLNAKWEFGKLVALAEKLAARGG